MDRTAYLFIAMAIVCFAIVGIGLKTRRIVGIAFRSRFIARREHEPVLYWASLFLFAGLGVFLAYAVASVAIGY
jgi:ABC-type uncharacterized transport system permease subunit